MARIGTRGYCSDMGCFELRRLKGPRSFPRLRCNHAHVPVRHGSAGDDRESGYEGRSHRTLHFGRMQQLPARRRVASGLTEEPGLWKEFVPVAFHVDYWNHLGWPDRFSSVEFTRRQRNYAAGWNATTIYTPEFVFNGEEWPRAGKLPAPSGEKPGRLRVTVENGTRLEVSFFSSVGRAEPLVVEIVPLAQGVSTSVPRGENAGKRLQHDFVALALLTATLVPSSDGVYSARLSLPETTSAPVASIAAWVRPANSAVPIQAAGGWIK